MEKTKKVSATIDEYISNFPKPIQERLTEMRELIQKIVPDATETISYQMPTFKLHGKYLVYFGAFKEHIGFFPFPSGVEAFKKEAADFVTSTGTIQFPYNRPFPVELITKILKYRAKENLDKAAGKY